MCNSASCSTGTKSGMMDDPSDYLGAQLVLKQVQWMTSSNISQQNGNENSH